MTHTDFLILIVVLIFVLPFGAGWGWGEAPGYRATYPSRYYGGGLLGLVVVVLLILWILGRLPL